MVRSLLKLQTKYGKVLADIKFIKTCKKERLIPTYAKVNMSITNATHKLRRKISLLVMNTELENKYSEKRKLKKEIKKICIDLERNLGLIISNTGLHQIRIVVKRRLENILKDIKTNYSTYVSNNSLTKGVTIQFIITLRAPCKIFQRINFQMMNELHFNMVLTITFLIN